MSTACMLTYKVTFDFDSGMNFIQTKASEQLFIF